MTRRLLQIFLVVTLVLVIFMSVLISKPDLLRHLNASGAPRDNGRAVCPTPGTGAFSMGRLNVTALFSFPGSGNTWFRHLVTTATGIHTASVYDTERDIPVTKSRARRVLVVKTHFAPKRSENKFPYVRAVLLIRNPYEALLSEFNRRGSYSLNDDPDAFKTGVRSKESFEKAWPRYVRATIGRWRMTNLAWTRASVPIYVVVYHRLQAHLETELGHVLTFLDQPQPQLLHCALQAPEGRSHRKKPDWQRAAAVFTDEQNRILNEDIDAVQQALERNTGQNFSDFKQWKR